MKTTITLLFLAAGVACQAALIPFGISPPGTDVAVGISPLNETNPPPGYTNTASVGGPISAGVVFDTGTSNLMLTIGYGTAAGFAGFDAAHATLNGPATTNVSGPEIADLSGMIFRSPEGGIIYGNLYIPPFYVSNLLAGLDYINLNENGAVSARGQLVPLALGVGPTVSCPEPSTVECGTPAVVTAHVGDAAGNALTVVWSLNDMAVQTNQIPASSGATSTNVVFSGDLPLGTNLVAVAVADNQGNMANCSTTVTVIDTIPPVIHSANALPNILWPPNHRMVTVIVTADVTDNCGEPAWRIVKVTSNQPVNGLGDGNTSPDWQILGNHKVALRAERSGLGSGRIYTITLVARDAAGNLSAPATVTVTVPKSMGHNKDDR